MRCRENIAEGIGGACQELSIGLRFVVVLSTNECGRNGLWREKLESNHFRVSVLADMVFEPCVQVPVHVKYPTASMVVEEPHVGEATRLYLW